MRLKVLVCDLDNTLYDWVGFFVPALYAMVDETVRIWGAIESVYWTRCVRFTDVITTPSIHMRYLKPGV